MNNTNPLRASREFVINPKQVIDAKAILVMNSVFRCLMITHSLAKLIEVKSKKAEERLEAIAAPYNPLDGE